MDIEKPFVIFDKEGSVIPVMLKQIIKTEIAQKINIAISDSTYKLLTLTNTTTNMRILEESIFEIARLFPKEPFTFYAVGEFPDELMRFVRICGAERIIMVENNYSNVLL